MSAWLLGIFALLGVVFGWIAFFRTARLQRQLKDLQRKFEALEADARAPADQWASAAQPLAWDAEPGAGGSAMVARNTEPDPSGAAQQTHPRWYAKQAWLLRLREHWMIWLGGGCVGLAGIFLVRYSIDQGMLGPAARIALALISGLALHAGAISLRLRGGAHPALAALAAGGSITLFAALLAALHLYQMLSPAVAFMLLAAVALGTMALALLQGPVLAMMGLLGAYAVPLLVGGDSGAINVVLVYVLIISAAALVLFRYVERLWLCRGVLAGAGLWWWLTLFVSEADNVRAVYLAAFVWLLYAIPAADWLLMRRGEPVPPAPGLRYHWRAGKGLPGVQALGLGLAVCAAFASWMTTSFNAHAWLLWTPFTLLVLWLAGRRHYLVMQAWLLAVLAWLGGYLQGGPAGANLSDFYWCCLGGTGIFVALALSNARRGDWRPWLPMLLLTPPAFLVLAWLQTPDAEQSLQWALLAALLGAVYLALAAQALRENLAALATAWFFIAAHVAYALAVAMYLSEASLTLALAAQMVSLAWLIRRFELPVLGWLLKGVALLVLLRLSLNPWLHQYPVDVHWSLWTYGGSTLCCWLGSRQLHAYPQLRAWAQGAAVHLLTLTIWAELRYWLYDQDVFAAQYSALEAGLNVAIFGALALVYHWRENFSERLARLYRVYSWALLVLALLNYLALLMATRASALWITSAVGDTRLFNSLWLLFGLPVVLAGAAARFYIPAVRGAARVIAAGAAFVFISVMIRHYWQRTISLEPPVLEAELYTYSVVWLLLAVAAMLGGAWRFGQACYRAGMLLLLLVVAKLFLVDMAGLQGLLRVASFLGMGLGLLGVAYLHKRLRGGSHTPSNTMSSGM